MRPARIWVVSDTHFGHERVLEFEPVKRPFDSIDTHDRELVLRWNNVVRPQDTVWHLGDVFFGKGYSVLPHLNGDKRLVLGNHDEKKVDILKEFFKIYGVHTSNKCIFTHIPVHPSQLDFRYKLNLHGHMHSNLVLDGYGNPDKRYLNCCVEHTDLAPVELKEMLARVTWWNFNAKD